MSTKEVVFGKNGASVITWLVRVLIVLLTLMEARNEYRMREFEAFVRQGSRFTAEDGREVERRVSALESRLPDDFPPSDFEKYLDERFLRIEQQIQNVQADILEMKGNL